MFIIKILASAILLFVFCFFAGFHAYASNISLEDALDVKKRTHKYDASELRMDQIVIDIYKLIEDRSKSDTEKERILSTLIVDGEKAWSEYKRLNSYQRADRYLYEHFTRAITDYYYSVNKIYMTTSYYERLAENGYEDNLLDIYLVSYIKVADTYLSLGQLELAKESIEKVKEYIDGFFEVDYESLELNAPYSIALNSNYNTLLIQYSYLSGDEEITLSEAQKFFDLMLRYYDINYTTPYVRLVGPTGAPDFFMRYDSESIKHAYLRQDAKVLFTFAKFFAKHGDLERADKALIKSVESISQNRGSAVDDFSGSYDSDFMQKFAFQNGGLAAYASEISHTKSKIKYIYEEHLYKAVVLAAEKKFKEAQSEIILAQESLKKLYSYYQKLAPEVINIDRVKETYPELLSAEALVYMSQSEFYFAGLAYRNLIKTNEEYRESLPIEYRRGFFRGYSKDAYIGMIKAKASEYIKTNKKEDFDSFLAVFDMLSARQLKDIREDFKTQVPCVDNLNLRLGKDEMVYILFDADDSYIAVGISQSIYGLDIIPKEKDFDKRIYIARDELAERHLYQETALTELTKDLLTPLGKYSGVKTIHLLADGAVSALPFDMLPLNGGMVYDKYQVDYMVSLGETISNKGNYATFLGVADPAYAKNAAMKVSSVDVFSERSMDISGYFQPLPETREEVASIAKLVSEAKLLVGTEAAESKLKSIPLSGYSIIHFATHGILGGEIPEMPEPALVLSEEDGEDSLLSVSEISKLSLDADLVVLSACNTGSGKYYRGEGITGIARGFKLAGASEIVASLWPVDSFATKSLMEYFYGYIRSGKSPSTALYEAKGALMKSLAVSDGTDRALKKSDKEKIDFSGYSNPYYWSAFVLIR